MRFKKYLKEKSDTYIVRKDKGRGIYIDQAFNSLEDAKKFSKLVKGNIFTIKGHSITPFM